LTELYQVPTKALNQAVRRNLDRFPEDFMFQLTREESDAAGNATCPMPSPNLALRCSPRFYEVAAPFR